VVQVMVFDQDLVFSSKFDTVRKIQVIIPHVSGYYISLLGLHVGTENLHSIKGQSFSSVWLQSSFVLLEDVVDKSVPPVEDWVSERG